VCLDNLTIRDEVEGGAVAGVKLWVNNCRFQGNGISTAAHPGEWTPAWSGGQYWTNSDITDDQNAVPGGVQLARNVHCTRVQDGIETPKLIVNCTWDTTAPFNNRHTDFISWNFLHGIPQDNSIVYNVSGFNLDMTGILFKDTDTLNNAALVNVFMDYSSPAIFGEHCNSLSHLLLLNVTSMDALYWAMPRTTMSNVSVRGCAFGVMGIYAGVILGGFTGYAADRPDISRAGRF